MADLFNISRSERVMVEASNSARKTVKVNGGTAYYGDQNVTSSTNDGNVTDGNTVVLTQAKHFVSASSSQLVVTPIADVAAEDIAIADDLTVAGDLAVTGTTVLTGAQTLTGDTEVDGALNHDGTTVGFYGVTPATRPTATADLKDGLTTQGLVQGTSATPLNLDGGALTAAAGSFTTLAASSTATLADATDIVVGSTTGTKIGTATTQKIGFYNVTPVVQPTAYTQTYSTATKTHSALTSVDVATTAATATLPFGYAEAQANAIPVAINAIRVDMANTKSVLNSIVDDLQALGLIS